jgi:hypothetical protein
VACPAARLIEVQPVSQFFIWYVELFGSGGVVSPIISCGDCALRQDEVETAPFTTLRIHDYVVV